MTLIFWDIYELQAGERIHGVKMRGRLRKFAVENEINVLFENATDQENTVRMAVVEGSDISEIEKYAQSLVEGLKVQVVLSRTPNPALSKLKVNRIERY